MVRNTCDKIFKVVEEKSLPPFTTKRNQKRRFYESSKEFDSSVFLVSIFCVVSYGGGDLCRCEQNGPGEIVGNDALYIPAGTTFDWIVIIVGNNEIAESYVSSYAAIIGPVSPIPALQKTQQVLGYYNDDEYGTEYKITGGYAYLYCGAEVGENNDNGSGASGVARISW
ncbi:MAG: hypothetical protein PVH88_02685 [Ignavibacteria bacterium]